jgi:hypothetical protein
MDSISQGISKLIRDKDGYPVFPNTKADLRYVTPAITREDADDATSNSFMYMVEHERKIAEKIIDNYVQSEKTLPQMQE